jgi:predicted ABC-type ATPase
VNADLLASGLSPLKPDLVRLEAGRLFLNELDRLAKAHTNFGFESTLSGLTYVSRLKRWKTLGYKIEIVFLQLNSPELALKRISERVKEGGHDVPRKDVLRRFDRGLANFKNIYSKLADAWSVYDNSEKIPRRIDIGP